MLYGVYILFNAFPCLHLFYLTPNVPAHLSDLLLSATELSFEDLMDKSDKGRASIDRNDSLYLPGGHKIDAIEEVDKGVVNDDPSAWPINSEKARQLRREFVQEGFRRLYSLASGGSPPVLNAIDSFEDNFRSNDEHTGPGDVEVTARFQQAANVGHTGTTNENQNQNQNSLANSIDGNHDWVYYAQ